MRSYNFNEISNLAHWVNTARSPVTLATGVSQLNDLSASGLHSVQATTTKQPLWTPSESERGAAMWFDADGTNPDQLLTGSAITCATATMFVVIRFETQAVSISRIYGNTDSGASMGMHLRMSATNGTPQIVCGTPGHANQTLAMNVTPFTTLTVGNLYLITGYVDTVNLGIATNYTAIRTAALASAVSDITSTKKIGLGVFDGGTFSQAFKGNIYEALTFNTALDLGTINFIRNKLNKSWGIW